MASLVHSLAPGGETGGGCNFGANNTAIFGPVAHSPPATTFYGCLAGTSMATPHVAGAIAAIRSACPNASADVIASALASTGVAVTDTRAGGSITKPRIRVDLAVQSACSTPTLAVSPATNMAGSGAQGGPFSPLSFQYQLSASIGTVGYSITGVPSWLTASSTSGTVGTGGTTITFTVNASANALTQGTYGPTTITFTNTTNGLGNTTRTATLTVTPPPPVLAVSPATDITPTGNQGGPFAPTSFVYQLTASNGTVNYSITGVPSWLSVNAPSGSVTTATPVNVTFTVNATANGLGSGTYSATVAFTNTTNGRGNTTRQATITVKTTGGATPNTRSWVSATGTTAIRAAAASLV